MQIDGEGRFRGASVAARVLVNGTEGFYNLYVAHKWVTDQWVTDVLVFISVVEGLNFIGWRILGGGFFRWRNCLLGFLPWTFLVPGSINYLLFTQGEGIMKGVQPSLIVARKIRA